jgi:dolichyl-phosphate-mannose-protein mannosyltransferase
LIGYRGEADFLDRYAPETYPFYTWLRWVPAFYGSFTGPLIFLALRSGEIGFVLSLCGGLMATFDLCLICESRYILIDGILHAFASLAIFTTFSVDNFDSYTFQWWITLTFSSFSCGCAIASKHTALGVIVFCIARHFFGTLRNQKCVIDIFTIREFLTRISVLSSFVFGVYCWSFAVHFDLLAKWTPEAVYMTEAFEQTLLQPNQTQPVRRLSLLRKFTEYNVLIIENNMKISSRHPYASQWWTWPLMLSHGTLFWESVDRHVWSIGNPFVWVSSTIGVVAALVPIRQGREQAATLGAVLIGWAVSFFPFAFVSRATWNYHYCIPLLFAIIALTMIVDTIQNTVLKKRITAGIIIGTILSFIWIAPVVYGLPVTHLTYFLPFKAWRSI